MHFGVKPDVLTCRTLKAKNFLLGITTALNNNLKEKKPVDLKQFK